MSAEPCLFEPDMFPSGWSWPLAPSDYQRDLTLSREEVKALARWTEFPKMGGKGRRKTVLALHRLRQPIADVLAITEAHKVAWRGTMRLLLEEMHHRQTPFWAWTVDDWIASTHVGNPRAEKWLRFATDCRQHFVAVGYILCGFRQLHEIGRLDRKSFIRKVFGPSFLNDAVQPVMLTLTQWGYQPKRLQHHVPEALAATLLFNRSPHLSDITLDTLETLYFNNWVPAYISDDLYLISRVLAGQGIIQRPLPQEKYLAKHENTAGLTDGIAPEWLDWCQRWKATTTLTRISQADAYYDLLRAGRWLAQKHPEITSPEQWTRDVAIEYVAAVDRMLVGEYTSRRGSRPDQIGKPQSPHSKRGYLTTMRTFFRDCQSWGWVRIRFDPLRCFATPRAIRARIGPNPRIIADDIWAKLLWAGLNLTEADMPLCVARDGAGKLRQRAWWYPLEMVKALAITWLFGGLRADEICRLRVGCIRWQWPDGLLQDFNANPAKGVTCLLDIPTSKTNTAFTKPVDRNLGEAIEMWERVRPDQPPAVDEKTGEVVHFLFSFRAYRTRRYYLNRTLIPMLCQKAGVPREDARGAITSHRARSTIASQLFNAKEPMSLFELQAWLGHRSPDTTQYYTKITPTRLAKSYQDAGYFERSLRTIEVLIDQESIRSGAAALGEPWRFYDLGHGYCTYDFFDQCPHRMACAKCAFYCPKDSSQAQLLEAKSNLQRMLQEIPLTDEEQAAVEDGLTAIETLSQQLMDVPTPAGPTPRQLAEEKGMIIPLLPVLRERG